jgi:hypothetical protein
MKRKLQDEICKTAYELYLRCGKLEGLDKEHWYEAERIVMTQYALEDKNPRQKPSRKRGSKSSGLPGGSKTREKSDR